MNFLSKSRVWLYGRLVNLQAWKYRVLYGMEIGEGTRISRKTKLDTGSNPHGVHIGKYSWLTGGVIFLTHDACRRMKTDTYLGDYCFVGSRTIILPGVRIGNEVVIGSGSVVTKDIPSNCIAAGNPAKIIKTGIHCDKWGIISRKDNGETCKKT